MGPSVILPNIFVIAWTVADIVIFKFKKNNGFPLSAIFKIYIFMWRYGSEWDKFRFDSLNRCADMAILIFLNDDHPPSFPRPWPCLFGDGLLSTGFAFPRTIYVTNLKCTASPISEMDEIPKISSKSRNSDHAHMGVVRYPLVDYLLRQPANQIRSLELYIFQRQRHATFTKLDGLEY